MDSKQSNAPIVILALLFSLAVSGIIANYFQPRIIYEDISHERRDIANPNANPTLFNAGLAIFIVSLVGLCGFIILSIWRRRQ